MGSRRIFDFWVKACHCAKLHAGLTVIVSVLPRTKEGAVGYI